MKISSKNTRQRLWVGGALLGLVAIAAALALVPRAGNGSAKSDGDGKGKEKAAVPLEFIPSEVARPVLARMPQPARALPPRSIQALRVRLPAVAQSLPALQSRLHRGPQQTSAQR